MAQVKKMQVSEEALAENPFQGEDSTSVLMLVVVEFFQTLRLLFPCQI